MNNLSCSVIQDLLPSYIDGLTSDDTNTVIKEHIAHCETCKKILDSMADADEIILDTDDKTELDFLKKQKRKLNHLILMIPVIALLFLGGSILYAKSKEVIYDFQEFAAGAKRGDTFCLGTYEQDGDESNGPEEIVWIVLNNKDGQLQAISKYSLCQLPYHDEDVSITWEESSLRRSDQKG